MSSEIERLRSGPDASEKPPADLVEVRADCPGGAAAVLDRVREVLLPIVEAPKPWPSTDEWRARLPSWFVDACSDDERVTTCVLDKWSLRAWVWWFQPEQRRWLWWDVEAAGDELVIRLKPTGTGSLLLGTVEWLLKASGATPRPS